MEVAEIGAGAVAWCLEAAGSLAPRLLWWLISRPTPEMSVTALLSAGLIAFAYYRWRLRRGGRPLPARRILKLMFPSKFVRHPSHKLDLVLMLASMTLLLAVIGSAILSYQTVQSQTAELLSRMLGAGPWIAAPEALAVAIATLVLFIAYEFAYWLDHYLSHRIPVLWEFHKVHHSAEVLSPITTFRVHPVDTLVFANISALVLGVAGGLLSYLFGPSLKPMTLLGFNAILLVFVYLLTQLQHSQVWIPFTGLLGHILASPAHHQIHHSTNPVHHNKNMGSCLVVFDWLFGTLHVPQQKREKLTFGIEATGVDHHSLVEGLVAPFRHAATRLRGLLAAAHARLAAASSTAAGQARPSR